MKEVFSGKFNSTNGSQRGLDTWTILDSLIERVRFSFLPLFVSCLYYIFPQSDSLEFLWQKKKKNENIRNPPSAPAKCAFKKGLYRFDHAQHYLQASLHFVGKSVIREHAGRWGGWLSAGLHRFPIGPGLHAHCAQIKEERLGTRMWSA